MSVLAHQVWSLPEAIGHLKKTMRLTTADLAKLAGVGFRTLQAMEQQRSEGSVQTMGRIFAVLSLKLDVVRAAPNAPATPANTRTDGHTPDQA